MQADIFILYDRIAQYPASIIQYFHKKSIIDRRNTVNMLKNLNKYFIKKVSTVNCQCCRPCEKRLLLFYGVFKYGLKSAAEQFGHSFDKLVGIVFHTALKPVKDNADNCIFIE